jgi:hypothetical protein
MVMVAGITIANAIAFQQFWKLYDTNREQGLAAFRGITKFRLVAAIGFPLLILTGIALLWLYQWTFAELLWFKIKMFLVLLLFVNFFTLGRASTLKLQKFLSGKINSDALQSETTRVRRNLLIFNLTQLSIFILIVMVVVFKFT